MKILMNILGVVIYFLNKFNNRKPVDGKKKFDIKFWIRDNWAELLIILLVDISLLILLITNDISFDLTSFVPEYLVKVGDLAVAWILGLGLASMIYNIIKKKISNS